MARRRQRVPRYLRESRAPGESEPRGRVGIPTDALPADPSQHVSHDAAQAPLSDIEASAAELRKLNEAVRRESSCRSRGRAARQEGPSASQVFHAAYDRLAFPGGLRRGMSGLAERNPAAVEASIRFLEADPWFFRSGYIKADVIKQLRRTPLSPDQAARLRRVILARVMGRDTREFRWYCRLARVVSDPDFRQAIEQLSQCVSEPIARRAEWVAAQIGACADA